MMGGPGSGRKHDPVRWRKATELRARGLSLPQISRKLGMTHQGVRDIIRRSGPAAALPAVRCAPCGATVASLAEAREFRGKTVLYYSWGNQQGTEFLAEAVYDGTLADFLRSFFPSAARGRTRPAA
jgi:hypothetical protein